MSNADDYNVTSQAIEQLTQLFEKRTNLEDKEFANGRFVRNVFESMVMNQARRLNKINSPSLKELQEISLIDIPMDAYSALDKDSMEIIELERLEKSHFFEEYIIAKPLPNLQNLNNAEYGVIAMMLTNAYSIIQQNLNATNIASEYQKKLWNILDAALTRFPSFQGRQLYRGELYCDIKDFYIEKTFVHPYYLTTSEDEQVADSIADKKFKWVISPSQNTKAVILPEYYGEHQIEFPRNTSFKVTRKDVLNRILYVEEVQHVQTQEMSIPH